MKDRRGENYVEETLKLPEVKAILEKMTECKLKIKAKYPGPEFGQIGDMKVPLVGITSDYPDCDPDAVDLEVLRNILLEKYDLGYDEYSY